MLLALLALALAPAQAIEPVLDWTLSGAAFPSGAESSIRAGGRQALWNRPGNPLLESTFLQSSGVMMVTPAFTRVDAEVAFQPATIFELRARYGAIGYYDAFTAVLLFDDPDAVYDKEERADLDRTNGIATRLALEPTLRMKVGPVVFIGWTIYRFTTLYPGSTTDTGQYWLEPELALLVSRTGTTWDHNALLAGELTPGDHTLYLGAYGTLRHAPSTDDTLARVGPVGVWMLPGGNWSLYGICQFYLHDRVQTRAAPPYVGVRLAWSLNPA